jgi:hypothetical protein
VIAGKRSDLDRELPDDPHAVVLVEARIVGVVGGHILQVARQRLEAQRGVAAHITQVHAPPRAIDPALGGTGHELLAHDRPSLPDPNEPG